MDMMNIDLDITHYQEESIFRLLKTILNLLPVNTAI